MVGEDFATVNDDRGLAHWLWEKIIREKWLVGNGDHEEEFVMWKSKYYALVIRINFTRFWKGGVAKHVTGNASVSWELICLS